MNQKTAKLLRTYARLLNRKPMDLRRWWESLNWKERTEQRIRIREDVAVRQGNVSV